MKLHRHLTMWDQMRMRHGITLRVLDQIPADKLNTHPIPGMRTPIELVVHMYTYVREFTEGVIKGKLPELDEKTAATTIKTKEQLLSFVNAAWNVADRNANAATEKQLDATVKSAWGSFPGYMVFGMLYDEYLHHRGQLYAFVRMFGIEPVMLWDYEHNASEFRPREHAKH